MSEFSVVQVQVADVIGDEALGSKTKFWFRRDDEAWLFKEARENTGEDWAEKVAAEIAPLLHVSAAIVELAEFQGRRGCACRSFVHPDQGEVLIHGNEILAGMVLKYDRAKKFHQSDHTLENIETAIQKMFPPKEFHDEILTILAGYLVLDALIGNTDRHHENWALLFRLKSANTDVAASMTVAPSFDHASSLGRELQDARRLNLLQSKAVETYVRNGRGAVYVGSGDRSGANPLRLAEFGARRLPDYFLPTLKQLHGFTVLDMRTILDRVPETRMSGTTRDFTEAFLTYTYQALITLVK